MRLHQFELITVNQSTTLATCYKGQKCLMTLWFHQRTYHKQLCLSQNKLTTSSILSTTKTVAPHASLQPETSSLILHLPLNFQLRILEGKVEKLGTGYKNLWESLQSCEKCCLSHQLYEYQREESNGHFLAWFACLDAPLSSISQITALQLQLRNEETEDVVELFGGRILWSESLTMRTSSKATEFKFSYAEQYLERI